MASRRRKPPPKGMRKNPKKVVETEDHVKDIVKDWFDARASWHYAPVQGPQGEHGIHDRVGCVEVTITPDMVGKKIGAFVSVEAKSIGRRGERLRGMTQAQFDHMKDILEVGGAATVCDGYEDLQYLEEHFPWLTLSTSRPT